jgi:ADP-heptose:LPS heptosyltransferase
LKSILVIQTAFIGDVVLATSLLEKLHLHFPHCKIDILLRKGNESLLAGHPFINEIIIWDKKKAKYKALVSCLKTIRSKKYDRVICLQRFLSGSILSLLSGAKEKVGFSKNPLSFLFTKTHPHDIGSGLHEVERNQRLIEDMTDNKVEKPKLYPGQNNFDAVSVYKTEKYLCIAPTSVWKTKEVPESKWLELISNLSEVIYLLGGPGDFDACEKIKTSATSSKVLNLAGKLSFLESAALMKDAQMNYVNDSAPQHFCSSVNAPVTTYYCSTTENFGFGPLSDNRTVIEVEQLDCKPCGLHGHKACPRGHFKCGKDLKMIPNE